MSTRIARRARYARANQPVGDLLVNSPAGFPSGQVPGVPGANPPAIWWWGSDSPLLAALHPTTALSAVTRATSLICNTIGSLPMRMLTGGNTATTSVIEVPQPRWLLDPQLTRPDARFGDAPPIAAGLRLTRSLFWAQLLRSTLLHGMGYLLFEMASDGAPVAGTLRCLNPLMVSPQEIDGEVVRRLGGGGAEWVDTSPGGTVVLGGRVYRLLELNNPLDAPDEYGMTRGVLEMHAAELGLAGQSVAYGRGMYRSGVPSGYLKTTVPNYTEAQAQALKSQWLANHGGDTRSVAVLSSTTEYVPLALSPVDMALIQMRQMSMVDIANAFGIPVHMLGGNDGGSNTYSNAESRNVDFRQFSLAPWAIAFEEMLTSLAPTGAFITVDFRGLLRPDTQTRYSAYGQALSDGWLTPDEVRALENLPPLPAATTTAPPTPTEIDKSLESEGGPTNVG